MDLHNTDDTYPRCLFNIAIIHYERHNFTLPSIGIVDFIAKETITSDRDDLGLVRFRRSLAEKGLMPLGRFEEARAVLAGADIDPAPEQPLSEPTER